MNDSSSLERMLVRFAINSFVVMLACIAIAALVLGHAFIRQESARAGLGQKQLQNAFMAQVGEMSTEMWTDSYGAIALRLRAISEQLGNVPYLAYLLDSTRHCFYSASVSDAGGKTGKCQVPESMLKALEALPPDASSALVFDEAGNRYVFAAPLAVGAVVKGFLVASVADPFRFYRGGIFGISGDLLLPILAAVILIWAAWLVFAYQLYLKPYLTGLAELKKNEALVEITHQVVHDIRSPLSVLEKLLYLTPQLPEELSVLFRGAIRQIKDTANNLLSSAGQPGNAQPAAPAVKPAASGAVASEPLDRLIDSVVSQMRVRWQDRNGIDLQFQVDSQGKGIFARFQTSELRQILTNLIDNAFESFEPPREKGVVRITLMADEQTANIRIVDTGKGIAPEILPRLGERGATFGKARGNGLGLFHARVLLASWGGTLRLDSMLGQGTTVDLVLRRVTAPAWFVASLKIPPGSEVVLLDDQPFNHQVIRELILAGAMKEANLPVHSFYDPESLRAWKRERAARGLRSDNLLHLFDYDLGQGKPNGLELVRELGIGDSTVIVTGMGDRAELQARCEAESVRLICRDDLRHVPIVIGGAVGRQ